MAKWPHRPREKRKGGEQRKAHDSETVTSRTQTETLTQSKQELEPTVRAQAVLSD